MLAPDRWDKRCPAVDEMTKAEIIDFLRVPGLYPEPFTEWEIQFCASLRRQMLDGKRVSLKQYEALGGGRLLQRLWSHDPDLWEFEPLDDDYDRVGVYLDAVG